MAENEWLNQLKTEEERSEREKRREKLTIIFLLLTSMSKFRGITSKNEYKVKFLNGSDLRRLNQNNLNILRNLILKYEVFRN